MASAFALYLLAQPVTAGPLEDGLTAYSRGDYVAALQILRPLAEHGNAVAQVKLGYMYLTGNGVSRDRSAAIKWWALGSGEAADGRAAFSVAEAYFKGKDGVEQDYTTAMRYYRIAASQGSAGARNKLNNMYVDSKGIGHRYDIAIVLFPTFSRNSERGQSTKGG